MTTAVRTRDTAVVPSVVELSTAGTANKVAGDGTVDSFRHNGDTVTGRPVVTCEVLLSVHTTYRYTCNNGFADVTVFEPVT